MVMTRLAFTDFSVSLDVDDVVDRKSPINQFHQKKHGQFISAQTGNRCACPNNPLSEKRPTHSIVRCECDIKGFEQISRWGVKQKNPELFLVVSRPTSVINWRNDGKLPYESFFLFFVNMESNGAPLCLVDDVVLVLLPHRILSPNASKASNK